jgi:tetratricopeptide (TPR) repeat protein
MPFLTAQGLVDLGNAQLSRLDLKTAETTLREAVALAQANHLPRSEARARMSLGSVLVQAVRDEEALPEVKAAMPYYAKGQSRYEINMGRILLGRIYRRRGEFSEVHGILREILGEAEAAGDKGKVSDTVGEIANVYATEEKFVEALEEFERRLKLLGTSNTAPDVGYSLVGKAQMLMHLGDFTRAKAAIEEAERRAGADTGVSRILKEHRLELLYRNGQWSSCAAGYAEALQEKQSSREAEMQSTARKIECLALSGQAREASRLASAMVGEVSTVKLSPAAAWLRVAITLTVADGAKRTDLITEALEYFRNREQMESLWMAEAVAASAYRRTGGTAEASRHTQASEAACKRLEQRLGAENWGRYRSAPVVIQYMKIGDLTR